MDERKPRRTLTWITGAALVVASMVGSGIFGTTGVLARDLHSPLALLLVWLVGGVLALCAALVFGELGSGMPEAGGEVHYLHRIFGPFTGFLAGVVTLVAGFAAPLGGILLLFGSSLEGLIGVANTARPLAIATLVALTFVHGRGIRSSARVNDALTVFKVLFVLVFIVAGFCVRSPANGPVESFDVGQVVSGAFANGLVLVAFAYTGWNAAAYLGGELIDPGRSLPRALVLGTGFVTLLYVLLNLVYLRASTPAELSGVENVGRHAAERLFGDLGGKVFAVGIAGLLLSTASSFLMAGTRVLLALSLEGKAPRILSVPSPRQSYPLATIGLAALAVAFLFAASFREILEYVGLLLTVSTALAVVGLFRARAQGERWRPEFRVPGHPWPGVAVLVLSAAMIVAPLLTSGSPTRPLWAALATLAAGTALWPLARRTAGLGTSR